MNRAAVWITLVLVVTIAGPALGFEDVPKTSGFSGFFLLGPGIFDMKTNLTVGGAPLLEDVGSKQIESIFAAPVSQTAPAFLTAGELNYTLSSSRTQFFLGNRLEDVIRLDIAFGAGVRQQMPDSSILALSVLFTPLDKYVWSDPYIEGEDRIKTDRSAPGARLRWSRILKSGFEFTTTFRNYSHGAENSGDWLIGEGRLDPADQALVSRDGNIWHVQLLYRVVGWKKHVFMPTIRYISNDFDGAALKNQGVALQLTYLYLTKRVVLDGNLLYHPHSSDTVNPIYGVTLDATRTGAGLTIFYDLFKKRKWRAFLGGEYVREDVNVDFYDTTVASVNLGLIWRYGRK